MVSAHVLSRVVMVHHMMLLKPEILTFVFNRGNFLGRYFPDKKIVIVLVASWVPYLRQISRVIPQLGIGLMGVTKELELWIRRKLDRNLIIVLKPV